MAQVGTLQHPALGRVRNEPDGVSDAEQSGSHNGTTGSDRPSSLPKKRKLKRDAVNRITQPAVKIDNTGKLTSLTETAKLALKLGVQLRDLRLLDPQVSRIQELDACRWTKTLIRSLSGLHICS
jgi:hypothetical protein